MKGSIAFLCFCVLLTAAAVSAQVPDVINTQNPDQVVTSGHSIFPIFTQTGEYFSQFGQTILTANAELLWIPLRRVPMKWEGKTLWSVTYTAGPACTDFLGNAFEKRNWPPGLYETKACYSHVKGDGMGIWSLLAKLFTSDPVAVTVFTPYIPGVYAGGALYLGPEPCRQATFGIQRREYDAFLYEDPQNYRCPIRITSKEFKTAGLVNPTDFQFTGYCCFEAKNRKIDGAYFEATISSPPTGNEFSLNVFDYSNQPVYQADGKIQQGGVEFIQ